MLNIGVEYEALSNPAVVARLQALLSFGDAVWCLAGEAPPEEVYDCLDSIGFDFAVVYGEQTHGYDILIGRSCGAGRDIGALEKSGCNGY
jgi:hypothetical protein